MQTTRVELLVAAKGNHFMKEISEWFAEGFQCIGMNAVVREDSLPTNDECTLSIVVAPHEYVPLFLDSANYTTKCLQGCAILNTEQPGSSWFTHVADIGSISKWIFDLNVASAQQLQRLGLPAVYTPLGHVPSLTEFLLGAQNYAYEEDVRPIDLVFLGYDSPRRAAFFANHAKQLSSLECRLIFAPLDRPRRLGDPNYLSSSERDALLGRSRILLNVHSHQRDYFEWHRAIIALSRGCVLVSETSSNTDPLMPGQHLLMSDADLLISECLKLLKDDSRRKNIAVDAISALAEKQPITKSCELMLDAANISNSYAKPFPPLYRRLTRSLCQLRNTARQKISSIPVAHRAYDTLYRARCVLNGTFSNSQISDRRRQIVLAIKADSQPEVLSSQVAPRKRISLSVVVTLYNYEKYIESCIASVAGSECSELKDALELIVVDDYSKDRSVENAKKSLQKTNLKWSLILKQTNTGLADSRNIGLEAAGGDYVFILDADNQVFPSCLQSMWKEITDANADAVYSTIARMDSDLNVGTGLLSQYDWDVQSLLQANYIDAMAMFNRKALLDIGGYDTSLIEYGWFGWEDYELWLRFAIANKKVVFVPKILSAYRGHTTSMINTTRVYRLNLSSLLKQRYSTLAAKYPHSKAWFGGIGNCDRTPVRFR